MRRRKPDLTARVNGNLALEFGPIQLTSYAGLELFGRYLQQIGFNALVRDVFVRSGLGGDFGPVAMVRVLMALLVVGGRRVRHVAFLHDDPLVRRFSGLRVVPTARTLSRWLQRFTMRTVARVQALNAAVVTQMLTTLNLATLTIDVDGTVVSTGSAGRAGLSRLQSAPPEGAELLPDPGARGRDHAYPPREESVRQHP